jgi:transcriptional regulator with XRE-family HTH domain
MVEQLRNAIRSSGQSLNQLSKVCGVGKDRISRFLRGERDLTFVGASRIAEALGIELKVPEHAPAPPAAEPEPAGPRPSGKRK